MAHKTLSTIIVLLFLAIGGFRCAAYAEINAVIDDGPNASITVGVGSFASTDRDMSGLGGTLEFNYRFLTHQLLTLRTTGYDDFVIDFFHHTKDGYGKDYGVLYGIIQQWYLGYISASAGVSYFEGRHTVEENETASTERTIGIPVELQAFFRPFGHWGIGLIGTADFNKKNSFYGVMLATQLAF